MFKVPFGKGQKFGAGTSKAVDLILGGWNINYNLAMRGGFPVTIFAATQNTNSGRSPRGNARANRYQVQAEPSVRTVDRWFGDVTGTTFCAAGVNNGTCAYGVPALGEFGSAGVGTERAPGFFNLDSSIGKNFAITERHRIRVPGGTVQHSELGQLGRSGTGHHHSGKLRRHRKSDQLAAQHSVRLEVRVLGELT